MSLDSQDIRAPLDHSEYENGPLDRFLAGVFLTLAGLAIILFHKSIKEANDRLRSRDWPTPYHDMWTPKFARGRRIIAYVVIIVIGSALVAVGISLIFPAFQQ